MDDKTALHYVHILKETGLVSMLFANKTGAALVKNPEKIFIENTSLYHAICYGIGQEVNIGMLRELFFVNALINSGNHVFYSKDIGDFVCNKVYFEIGGKNKNRKIGGVNVF